MNEDLLDRPPLSERVMTTNWAIAMAGQCLKDVDRLNHRMNTLHSMVSSLDKDPDRFESIEVDDKKLQEGIAATTAAIVATRTAIGRISAELDSITALLNFE